MKYIITFKDEAGTVHTTEMTALNEEAVRILFTVLYPLATILKIKPK